MQHLLLPLPQLCPARVGGDRNRQVLRNRQVREHLVALRHQRHAEPRDPVRLAVLDPLALEADRALGHAGVVGAMEAGDGAQERGLAGAVGANDADDLARSDGKRNALHGRDDAMIDDLDVVDGEERHRRGPAACRCLKGHSRKYDCTRCQIPTSPSGSKTRNRIITAPKAA